MKILLNIEHDVPFKQIKKKNKTLKLKQMNHNDADDNNNQFKTN